jgi:hypothetical protein
MRTLNFNILSWLNTSAVWPHAISMVSSSVVVGQEGVAGAVLLGSGGFDLFRVSCASAMKLQSSTRPARCAYLESNGVGMRVLQAERLRHLMLEGSWLA